MNTIPNSFILVSLTILLFNSCENPEQYKKITGHWECIHWTSVENPNNRCREGNVYFKFQENKTYESRLGQTVDKGSYKLNENSLTVSPENKLDIKVDMLKLNDDTLSLLMNSGGIEERMILVKR